MPTTAYGTTVIKATRPAKKPGLPNHAQLVSEVRQLAARLDKIELAQRDRPEPERSRGYCDDCGSRLPHHFDSCTATAAQDAAQPHGGRDG